MKHCHITIMCNELPFIQQKLPFLYNNSSQIIIVDYNIVNKCNSTDGSIEFINSFPDPENKLILIKDFKPENIHVFNGVGSVDKQKMFAHASKYVNDDIDLVWATDADEFFDINLIGNIENIYKNDKDLISVDIPHLIFAYNQYNVFNKQIYICPRITRHIKNKIYGHCNFGSYGKTIKYDDFFYYHIAFVGYNRCKFKFQFYGTDGDEWLNIYLNSLTKVEKYIHLQHPNKSLGMYTIKFDGTFPKYVDINLLITSLNDLK